MRARRGACRRRGASIEVREEVRPVPPVRTSGDDDTERRVLADIATYG
jgi:hypothetical protein